MKDTINRKIAELMGWKVERRTQREIDVTSPGGETHTMTVDCSGWDSDQCWGCAEGHLLIPRYTTDLNEAINLWSDIPFEYTPRLVRMITPKDGSLAPVYKAHILENTNKEQFEAIDHNPALAICKVWLEWRKLAS